MCLHSIVHATDGETSIFGIFLLFLTIQNALFLDTWGRKAQSSLKDLLGFMVEEYGSYWERMEKLLVKEKEGTEQKTS